MTDHLEGTTGRGVTKVVSSPDLLAGGSVELVDGPLSNTSHGLVASQQDVVVRKQGDGIAGIVGSGVACEEGPF